jgi:NAD(P)-dependent dehydrogenase (short-subunit alcohol dehydrogenase family)
MRNVVITGSTRGIGFCLAIEFFRAGANAALSGRSEVLMDDAIAQLSPYTGKYN